jgi:hypothetical protein
MKNEQHHQGRTHALAVQSAIIRSSIEKIGFPDFCEFYADADLIERIEKNGPDKEALQQRAKIRSQSLLTRADKTKFPVDKKVLSGVSQALQMAANVKTFLTFDNILLADAVDDVLGNPPEATELFSQRRLAAKIRAGV